MKRIIISFLAILLAVSVNAQDNKLKFTIGGCAMFDAAYIKTQSTPMKSGFAITDTRIRTSLTYGNWTFFEDLGFYLGKFDQRDLTATYNYDNHFFTVGHFTEPPSSANNTSGYYYHFINTAMTVNAFESARQLGFAYKFSNNLLFLNQGVYAENKFNTQASGSQGFSASSRWLLRPINNENLTLHFGVTCRYAQLNTGVKENGILKTNVSMKAAMENTVDPDTKFVSCDVPWAKTVVNLGAEGLFMSKRFFIRGLYIVKKIWKDRPDELLFKLQQKESPSWSSLDQWQKNNPIRPSQFEGGYAEAGCMIVGDGYTYSNSDATIDGLNSRALEIVARFNYTNLNDITRGEVFVRDKGRFYKNGEVSDYPTTPTSIAGGKVMSYTLGLNFAFNKYIHIMADYTFCSLDNVYYPKDKQFHIGQARVMFIF